jgi:hypothetical protein
VGKPRRTQKVLGGALATSVSLSLLVGVASAVAPTGGQPTVSGTAQQGQKLNLTQGTWTGATSVTDQWQDCDSGGANCSLISGATGSSYTLQPGDVGFTIEVLETATNAGDSPATSSTASSTPTAVVTAIRLRPTPLHQRLLEPLKRVRR